VLEIGRNLYVCQAQTDDLVEHDADCMLRHLIRGFCLTLAVIAVITDSSVRLKAVALISHHTPVLNDMSQCL
jgi:hypothetical protein